MNKTELTKEIFKNYNDYRNSVNKDTFDCDKLDKNLSNFCQIATPEQLEDFLKDNNGNYRDLSGDTLSYALINVFKNTNTETNKVLFQAIESKYFLNVQEVNWEMVFNSLSNIHFSSFNSDGKPEAMALIEKHWNKNEIFKVEETKFFGFTGFAAEIYSYGMLIEQKYGGSFYEYLQDNVGKLNYILEQDIPYSQIKNIFFQAIGKEDTRTIGRLLHTKYAVDLSQDKEVKEYLNLDVSTLFDQSNELRDLKKEVLTIVIQLESKYKDMLANKKDQTFLKHKKI